MKRSEAWPRQPFVGLALAAVLGILLGEVGGHAAIWLAIFLGAAAAAFWRGSTLLTLVAVAAAFASVHAQRQADSPGRRLARLLGEQRRAVAVRGVVVSEPRISPRGTASFQIQVESVAFDDRTIPISGTITARWPGTPVYGDELQLFGVIQPVPPPRNPGEFDLRAYLARHDIYHSLGSRNPESGRILAHERGSKILRAAQRSRAWMQAALGRGLEDAPDLRGVISGMVLGANGETPDEIQEQFQQTGTLHLFAVSGLNVAILAQLLWMILRAARLPRRWAIAAIIPALFFYAAITGLGASSIRAALMAAVLLGGYFIERRVFSGNSVAAAAVLVLAWDPNQLFSTGFQLSFAVVIAIMLFARPLYLALERRGAPDPFLPPSLYSLRQRGGVWLWRALAGGATVSLAAWIGSLPLILPYFYIVTPVSLLANLVVVPLAFLVLAVGLMSLLVLPVAPALTLVFNNANWCLAAGILGAVGLFARAPAGHIYLGAPRWPHGALAEMTVLDLGAGACTHLKTRGRDWLVDTGSERDARLVVRGYLRSRGVNRLDGLVLTHGDAAHLGGAATLLRIFQPREWLDNAAPDRSPLHRALLAEKHRRRTLSAPNEFLIGPQVRAEILFPPAGFAGKTADDMALVIRLTIAQKWRVLLMSDSGEATERVLLESGADLRSDLLVKGQHHAAPSGTTEFLEAVQPAAIIATSRDFPENERLPDGWVEEVKARGIELFRQDETGAVTVRFYREHWEASRLFRQQDLPQPEAVDFLPAEALFKARGRQRRQPGFRNEALRVGNHLRHRAGVVRIVGGHAQEAVRPERAPDSAQKLGVESPAHMMPPLRPRIGKQEVEDVD